MLAHTIVEGCDFEAALERACAAPTGDLALASLVDSAAASYATTGLQATALAAAEATLADVLQLKAAHGAAHRVVLCYTSNLVSCGLRETFAALIDGGAVDVVVTTAGGIEEDVIKCLGPTLVGDFGLKGAHLRGQGMNRVGNLLIPNSNYVHFEALFHAVLRAAMLQQQASGGVALSTPSELLRATGERLHVLPDEIRTHRDAAERASAAGSTASTDTTAAAQYDSTLCDALDVARMETEREHSVTYQCWRRGVPVFCPALTDGSMGDMIFFFNYSTPGLIVDPLGDERALVDTLASATHGVSVVLLGAGLPKHHALAAVRKAEAVAGTSLLHAVVSLTTGVPGVDGSVSGGCETDDVSGGLLRPTTTSNASARVEATAAFPLLCARALTR